jgi:hypothetical protein
MITSVGFCTRKYGLLFEFCSNKFLETVELCLTATVLREPHLKSVICTLNDMVGIAPGYVQVDQMSNSWFIPVKNIPDFVQWIGRLLNKDVDGILDKDRLEREWS